MRIEKTDFKAPPKAAEFDLESVVDHPNLAMFFDSDELAEIGTKVYEGYDTDLESRQEWYRDISDAVEQVRPKRTEKTFPWPGAANVNLPIITHASVQFASEAFPALVSRWKGAPVGASVVGEDPDGAKRARADRVSQYMSWQITSEMGEWIDDMDSMLHSLPVVGCMFKKSYFDPDLGRSCSDLVYPQDLIVDYWTKSLADCPRISHKVEYYPHEIRASILSGVFLDHDYTQSDTGLDDQSATHEFIEQHCRLDLDKDGYAEPWIVTIHKETRKVARITAGYDADDVVRRPDGAIRLVRRVEYFTKYSFIRSPDGGFYDVGFGVLLLPLSETMNTLLNQMLDAGTLANTGGGFIGRGLRIRGGQMRFKLGEYMPVDVPGDDIHKSIYNFQFPGPSPVLFTLLGFLFDLSKDLASVKDVLTGDTAGASTMSPTTMMAMVERGLKVFSATFARIHRSFSHELKLLYRLNRLYLPQTKYASVLDDPLAVSASDFDSQSMDISPSADPEVVTGAQRIFRAQSLLPFANDPMFNSKEIVTRYLEALRVPNIEGLWSTQPPAPPPEAIQAKAEHDRKVAELTIKAAEAEARIVEMQAKAMRDFAEAEDVQVGTQLDQYRVFLEQMRQDLEGMRHGFRSTGGDPPNGAGVPQMAQGPGYGAGVAVPGGLPGQPGKQMG